ncbi:MAG: EscU/YscU/HrcU family type III secretion system export apparatus switch protein [Deltaproteobacteria bacterium]|nr:EscU/YscU/HrcU family type III secretion system export apparatus switch protein [Deltaproteobacteria bacterium]
MTRRKYRCAVGLSYSNRSGEVPLTTICEQNFSADEIVRLAHRFGVPVVEKPELARALQKLGADREIPEHLYEAVATVLYEIEQASKRSGQ